MFSENAKDAIKSLVYALILLVISSTSLPGLSLFPGEAGSAGAGRGGECRTLDGEPRPCRTHDGRSVASVAP